MFKIHYGQCIDCPKGTRSLIVVKSMRCKYHNYNYKQAKKTQRIEKFTPKTGEEKKQVFSSIKQKFRMPTGELAVFKEIWKKKEHISELSLKPILYFDIWCFSHILSK